MHFAQFLDFFFISSYVQQVIFTPLFVARTHLPSMLGMNVETSRLKSHYQVELQGQGHEEHIHMIGGDMTHNITFQLRSVYIHMIGGDMTYNITLGLFTFI